MKQQALVIGAGITGLASAALLARRGFEVTVVEKNRTTGGRAGEITDNGFRFETGPSWYLMPDAYEQFFQLMGTTVAEQLELRTLDPAYRMYTHKTKNNQLQPTHPHTVHEHNHSNTNHPQLWKQSVQ